MCIKVPVTSPCTLFLLLQTRDSNFVLQNVYVPLEKCTQRSAAWGILTIYSLLGFCSPSAFFMVQSFGSLLLLLKKKLCLHLSLLHLGDSGEEKRESQTLCHYLQAAGGTNHFLKIWHWKHYKHLKLEHFLNQTVFSLVCIGMTQSSGWTLQVIEFCLA